MTEVKIRKGESVEKALRRLKKKLDREGIMRDIRAKRHFEKPCEKRRRKAARARINARRATVAAALSGLAVVPTHRAGLASGSFLFPAPGSGNRPDHSGAFHPRDSVL